MFVNISYVGFKFYLNIDIFVDLPVNIKNVVQLKAFNKTELSNFTCVSYLKHIAHCTVII